MKDALLQDWATFEGTDTTPWVQDRSDWLDLQPQSDAVFFLEVRGVTNPGAGGVTISYETAPAIDDSLFQPLATLTLSASLTPVVTRVILATNPAVPLARYVRWKLTGTDVGSWSATIRVTVLSARSSGAFSPASLPLSGWWRDYPGSVPWSGSTSGGTSGSHATNNVGTAIPTGASLNGHATASLNGTNGAFTTVDNMSALFSTTSVSGWILVNPTSIAHDDAVNPYNNDSFIVTQGASWFYTYMRQGGGTPKAGIGLFNGTTEQFVETTGITTGSWHLVQFKYDGTNLKIRVDSGAWQSLAAGPIGGGSSAPIDIGRTVAGTVFTNALVSEFALSSSVLADSDFDSVKGYVNSRYGLSL
jgi:hypothetical protein